MMIELPAGGKGFGVNRCSHLAGYHPVARPVLALTKDAAALLARAAAGGRGVRSAALCERSLPRAGDDPGENLSRSSRSCSAAEYAAWQGWGRSSRIAITVGPGAASVRGAASRTQHHGGAVAPNFLWPLGVPFGSMGTRLRKTDRCNHRRAKERRSAGDLGWSPFPARSKG